MIQEVRNKRKRKPSTFPRFSQGSGSSIPLEIALVRSLMGFNIDKELTEEPKLKISKK